MSGPGWWTSPLFLVFCALVAFWFVGAWKRRRTRAIDLQAMDQVEALAIAVAMALVLKFFIIEAFQIPTGSMQPLILGSREANIHDRVLVDKLVTMIREPRRWEVMVFRFPFAETASYIKRLVGLPGETLSIRGGDIWVDGGIVRKPDHVVDAVLKDVFPNDGDGVALGRHFVAGSGVTMRGTSATFAPGADRPLRLRRNVAARYDHGYDPDWGIPVPPVPAREMVPDLEVTLEVALEPGAVLEVVLQSDGSDTVFRIPAEDAGAPALVEIDPRAGAARRTLLDDATRAVPPGEAVEVAARVVDRRIVLEVDGEEWLRHDDDASGPRPHQPKIANVTLGVDGGGRLDDVNVRRDIFYTRKSRTGSYTWEIPEDHYFMLGDNTQASLDARDWEIRSYDVRREDGSIETIEGFWFPEPSRGPIPPDANPKTLYSGGGRVGRPIGKLFMDLHGDVHRILDEDIVDQSLRASPFVHERYILGKAIAVFWPVYDPFRWKLIR